ncbi:MAG: bifunctional oligoribonuclease/PAP phosphatase NrnA [Desulfotomaculaceae bacterium]|nr:bifunctional oligoribonuclease/PAP phosphatase NrnA [Desulfotomaculaceae bacterium]
MSKLADVARVIERAQRVLICGHVTPDGDSFGSTLALGLTLEQLGKTVTLAGPDPVPEIYKFLPGVERFVTGPPPDGKYDTFIVLDCSTPERLGEGYRDLLHRDMVTVNIDHHIGSADFGEYRYVDPHAAAVGEIVFDLFGLMGVKISPEAAICLYIAIITDTGSFQYDNTTPGTHRRVAKLLEIGIPATPANIRVYEEKPRAFLRLLGAALNTLSESPCGRVCWMTITRDIILNAGAEDEHAEGLVNYTRRIKGVEVGLLFRETAAGSYKISFRSKYFVDVNKLAAIFGGGGHLRAAGCVIQGDLNKIRKEVVAAAIRAAGGNNH